MFFYRILDVYETLTWKPFRDIWELMRSSRVWEVHEQTWPRIEDGYMATVVKAGSPPEIMQIWIKGAEIDVHKKIMEVRKVLHMMQEKER